MKKTLALVLSFVILLSLSASAWADGEETEPAVVVTDEGDTISVIVNDVPVVPPAGDTITDVNLTDTAEETSADVNDEKYDVSPAETVTALVNGGVSGSISTESSGEGNQTWLVVDGDVTNISNEGNTVQATSTDTGFDDPGEGDRIKVTGSVVGGETGIKTEGSNTSIEIVVLENVTGSGTGIDVSSSGGGVTTADVYGNVNSGVTGIEASGSGETGETETHLYIAGYVSSEHGAGIHAASEKGDNWTSVIVENGVSGGTDGIIAEANESTGTNVTAGGNVTGETGIVVDNRNSSVWVSVADPSGGAERSGDETPIRFTIDMAKSESGATRNQDDTYNVMATKTGIEIKQSHADEGKNAGTNITIDGVLSVEEGGTPILLGEAVTETDAGNINITVWKIEGQGEGKIVSGGGEGAAEALQNSIHYIIKIADDEDSRMVFGDHYQNGDTLMEGEHEIMLTVPEGCEIASAYATNGTEVPITRGSDGRYYAKIPAGGGILLNATLTRAGGSDCLNPDTGAAAASAGGAAGGDTRIVDGKYLLTLTTRVRTMTFVRGTLERFARLNDAFLIKTPYGLFEISLSEILNFNEKAVNFRFDLTDEAFEIFANNEPAKSISLSEFA